MFDYGHILGRGWGRGLGGKWGKRDARLRIGSWNIKTLTGKSIELVKIPKKRRINIVYVQETKWIGLKAKDVDEYKLWFSGRSRYRNGVGILVDSELKRAGGRG
ncbi:hypothetical protein K7X08_035608 [Anisodus acutangulus]|uniref:Uncharacterized protein n=1 Tax=Anisodus acutangulus TaxID=402998 RepID=A0A9Q1LKH0_9SOLA|nr:hypothetical protein K7X08_035608 [Anisodus acutangulus]